MTLSWNTIFRHYDGASKLEKVKKKIYFFISSFFVVYYLYYILSGNDINQWDLYVIVFSLFFNIVTFVSVILFKTTKRAVYISTFNDVTNTSLAIWFTGGPYSLDILWYFTLILGLVVLVETKIGLTVALLAFCNIAAIFYAESRHWYHFRADALSIDLASNAFNMASIFIVLIIIIFFVTKKDLYEEEIITEKNTNISTLSSELEIKLKEINNLRTDIARDFHDVMGNKLASIANISQMLHIKNEKYVELNEELSRINSLSKELYDGTKDFIWAMDNSNNSLHSVYFYIKDFGEKLFEYSGIHFISHPLADEVDDQSVSSLWSSQFVLIAKEILTNAMVHSQATEVKILFEKAGENTLSIQIIDNGIGYHHNKLKRINGLQNIQNRAETIRVKVTAYSLIGQGTKMNIIIDKNLL